MVPCVWSYFWLENIVDGTFVVPIGSIDFLRDFERKKKKKTQFGRPMKSAKENAGKVLLLPYLMQMESFTWNTGEYIYIYRNVSTMCIIYFYIYIYRIVSTMCIQFKQNTMICSTIPVTFSIPNVAFQYPCKWLFYLFIFTLFIISRSLEHPSAALSHEQA